MLKQKVWPMFSSYFCFPAYATSHRKANYRLSIHAKYNMCLGAWGT